MQGRGVALSWLHPGGVAQLVERYVRNVEVGGSSPLTSTPGQAGLFFAFLRFCDAVIARLSRAVGLLLPKNCLPKVSAASAEGTFNGSSVETWWSDTERVPVKKREGVKLGRPVVVDQVVTKRIARERRRGRSLRAIAEGLNEDGVGTAHGGEKWHASSVKAILDRIG